jgi:hypothetical protein
MSLDEVNQDLAGRFAAANGLEIDCVALCGPAPHDGTVAILYDLDHLPPETLEKLKAGCSNGAVAVHSYSLSARQIRALRRRGVIVTRRLTGWVFARLRAAAAGRSVASR